MERRGEQKRREGEEAKKMEEGGRRGNVERGELCKEKYVKGRYVRK